MEAFAARVSWGTPALPDRAPAAGEALVWFRDSLRPAALIDAALVRAEPAPAPGPRETSPEVGAVLRRA